MFARDVSISFEIMTALGVNAFLAWCAKRVILPLDIFLYRNIMLLMPRAATTTDVFNAIGEPRRREIIDLLVNG
jgi:hypothetical protein